MNYFEQRVQMLDVFVYDPQHVRHLHDGIVAMVDKVQVHVRPCLVHPAVVRFVHSVLVDVYYGSGDVAQNSVSKTITRS